MSKYLVTVYFTDVKRIEVKAKTKREAISKVHKKFKTLPASKFLMKGESEATQES